jgi:hypothetical protein
MLLAPSVQKWLHQAVRRKIRSSDVLRRKLLSLLLLPQCVLRHMRWPIAAAWKLLAP